MIDVPLVSNFIVITTLQHADGHIDALIMYARISDATVGDPPCTGNVLLPLGFPAYFIKQPGTADAGGAANADAGMSINTKNKSALLIRIALIVPPL